VNWISVKDRLPYESGEFIVYVEKDVSVTCCYFDTEYSSYCFKTHQRIKIIEWVKQYGNCCDDLLLKDVTHWMLLPPKPEDK
jgi:hypothetical protein